MKLRILLAALPVVLLLQACGGEPDPAVGETASPASEATVAFAPAGDDPAIAASASTAIATEAEPTASASTEAIATPSPAASPSPVAMVAATPPGEFAMCRACHSVEPGRNGVGPSLHGIVGEKAGAVPGYAFSAPLKASGIVWNRATLDQWLTSPMKMVPGTKMVLSVSDPAKRKAIIDYLVTLK
jgi:cytochrome c